MSSSPELEREREHNRQLRLEYEKLKAPQAPYAGLSRLVQMRDEIHRRIQILSLLQEYKHQIDESDRRLRALETQQKTEEAVELSADNRTARFHGQHFKFGEKQGKVVSVLYNAYKAGTPEVRESVILARAGEQGSRIRDMLKHHPAWDTLIIKTKPGYYRLKLP